MHTYGPDHVQAALEDLGLDIKIKIFEQPTSTAQEAADAVGTELGSIVKSLCFTIKGEPIVVLTSGDKMVDTKKLAGMHEVGRKKVKIASPELTIEETGYAPGGVAPVGHSLDLPIFIDEKLGRFETVYAAAGSDNSIFPIPFETLVSVTGGQIADVVVEDS